MFTIVFLGLLIATNIAVIAFVMWLSSMVENLCDKVEEVKAAMTSGMAVNDAYNRIDLSLAELKNMTAAAAMGVSNPAPACAPLLNMLQPIAKVSECVKTDLHRHYSFNHTGAVGRQDNNVLVALPNGDVVWVHERCFKDTSFVGKAHLYNDAIVVSFKCNLADDGDVYSLKSLRERGA